VDFAGPVQGEIDVVEPEADKPLEQGEIGEHAAVGDEAEGQLLVTTVAGELLEVGSDGGFAPGEEHGFSSGRPGLSNAEADLLEVEVAQGCKGCGMAEETPVVAGIADFDDEANGWLH